MNEIKEINEIEQKDNNINNNNDNDILLTDLLKYNFNYATKFNSMNNILNPISKNKFLLQIFLISSKLNIFNKVLSLDKLYTIYNEEKNFKMIYYIISKLVKYIKLGKISIRMINTNMFFIDEFLSNEHNYYFGYKLFYDLKKISSDSIYLDKKITQEINDYIKNKISFFYNIFNKMISIEQITLINKIINDIISSDNNNKIDDDNNNNIKENEYIFLINKIWLLNAKNFIGNYLFAKETLSLKEFLKDSFDLENILSVFLSDIKINLPLNNKTYYPFPGPINNFFVTNYKDYLYDPYNNDENYFVNKYMIEKEDYYWIKKEEWIPLKEVFGCTNEIRRKKENKNMIQLNSIIFDYRLKKYKNECINFFKKKVVQISKNKNIKDLENKIIKCLDYEINNIKKKNNEINNDLNDNNNNTIFFYKVNKNNRDIIIEMFLSFISDINTYESIFFEEIIITEEDKNQNIEKILLNKYNPKTELLIIEINNIQKNPIKFLLPINIKNNNLICSICNKQIEDLNDTKYMCELCSMYIFCSKQCSNIAQENTINNIKINYHKKLHIYLSDIDKKNFDLNEFLNQSFYNEIYTIENKNKSKGQLGLFNLGNTCYMNCSLQCLSNTKDLTKYFINNYFQNEINIQTQYGSNGVLLKVYSDLINLIWFSKFSKINPYFFRISFIESTHKFTNNQQQDAMEFLSILLNYLHEDLNRIREKPYEMLENQKENETDIDGSKRFYDYNLRRDNSIIIDLFYGQFQNVIKCIGCNTSYKRYDPFLNVTLPIPEEHNFYIIKLFSSSHCKYITMNINSDTTFEELVEKATKFLSKEILEGVEVVKKEYGEYSKYAENLLKENIEIVKLDKNKVINKIFSQPDDDRDIIKNNQKKLKKYINNEEEIVLFERPIIPDYNQNIYVYPITTDPKDDNTINFLSYPVVFSVKHNLTFDNLEKLINERFKSIIIPGIKNNHIIDLHILHSDKNINTGIMKIINNNYKKCIFCGNDYGEKKFCPLYLYFNKTDTISKIFNSKKISEPFVLLARSSYYDKNKEVYPGFNFDENNILNKHKNIYDSLNLFNKFQYLGEDNLWNCPKCKKKKRIGQGIKIYKPPNYLIIQLKRFKKKSNGFFNFLEGDKNETFVSFPTKNLDLTNYIEGPLKTESIYNLYAVINHKSLLGFNHFTAFCRNNKKWIEYDDSKINYIKDPVTSEAYILFYIKKNIDENY